ncbi:MAG: SEL1-like repeat protein [Rhodobacter sp.]|nr:SEL1-like repeat protein [Rhodobacter sp.]
MISHRFIKHLLVQLLCLGGAVGSAFAAGDDGKMQILFVGASPAAGAPEGVPAVLPIIAIGDLPSVETAKQEIFASRLRSSPVSTFVSEPSPANGEFDQFFLIAEVTLVPGESGPQFGVGGDSYALGDFAARMSSVVGAFTPEHRRIGFLSLTDGQDAFPMAMTDIQDTLDSWGFDMLVLMIRDGPAGSCGNAPAQALHYSVISGLADRVPFGNGDGISTAVEVEAYLTRALKRQTARDPVCGPSYSLILKASNDPAHPMVTHNGKSAFGEMEAQLYHETFEAMFLMDSPNAGTVQDFLNSCVYCPNEVALLDRLQQMEDRARTAALETEIWTRIEGDEGRDRLVIYVENCALCTYRERAEERIADIDAKAAALARENEGFRAASETGDLEALRAYVDSCHVCTHAEAAGRQIAEIEADTVYQAERAMLEQALGARSLDALQAYLDGCKICDGRDAVAAAVLVETRRIEFSAPCLALAALPQHGGPRKLEAIDQDMAHGVCEIAAKEFPDDGLIRTMLGRVAQAAGDFETAKAAYDFGMADNTPAAYGLAAYSHYAPPQGEPIDLDKAEDLALVGAEMGDWLSQEILTVIYSKGLAPDKTPADAFAIAQNIADEGNALAQFFVGYYYLTGTGVEPNAGRAAAWLQKSVDQGYTHAYSFLAELHEHGKGTEQQPDRAAELYWTALEKGDPTATDRLTTQLGNRDREVIRIIQQRLRDEGVFRGSVDGIAGPSTVTAIQRYAESLTEAG